MSEIIDCRKLNWAFRESIDFLDEGGRNSLLFHLSERYQIRLADSNCSSTTEIEKALRDMLGQGASIILSRTMTLLYSKD